MKPPSPNIQAPKKLQAPNSNAANAHHFLKLGFWCFSGAWMLMLGALHAQTISDQTLAAISFEQKLNSQISLDSVFLDEQGRETRLKDFFGDKPVILVLGYYGCPML